MQNILFIVKIVLNLPCKSQNSIKYNKNKGGVLCGLRVIPSLL
jgi:hypothetical protein